MMNLEAFPPENLESINGSKPQYVLTEDPSESLVDSIFYLKCHAGSVKTFIESLQGEEVNEYVKNYISTLTKAIKGKSKVGLDLLHLPKHVRSDEYSKKSHGAISEILKKDPMRAISAFLKFIEHHFQISPFRVNHVQEAPELEQVIEELLTSPLVREERIDTLIRYLFIDSFTPPGGVTDLTVEDQFKKLAEIKSEITKNLSNDLKLTKSKSYLGKEVGSVFLEHYQDEAGSQFNSILESYHKRMYSKNMEIDTTSDRARYAVNSDQFLMDHRYERFDLTNQASTGLIELNTNFIIETKTFSVKWVASIKNTFGIYVFEFKTVSSCEVAKSGIVNIEASYPYCTVLQLMREYLDVSKKAERNFGIEVVDFDYLAVYFDEQLGRYKYLEQNDTFVHLNTSLSIFNHHDNFSDNTTSIKIILSPFYKQTVAPQEKNQFLFIDSTGNATIRKLFHFLRETLDPDAQTENPQGPVSHFLWFALEVNFLTDGDVKTAEEYSASRDFQWDTPLSEVVKLFWAGKNRDQGEKYIDLTCFKAKFTLKDNAKPVITIHSQTKGSDHPIEKMLTVESVLTFLFKIADEKHKKLTGIHQTIGKFRNNYINFYLPNELIIDVRTITTKITHDEDFELEYLLDLVPEKYKEFAIAKYRPKGGIIRVEETVGGEKKKFYRPFTIFKEKGYSRFVAHLKSSEKVFNVEAMNTDIVCIYYSK